MKTTRKQPLDLAAYDPAWRGWKLSSYGRSSISRLIAPDGTTFQPWEILALAGTGADLDYLRQRVRELEGDGLEPRQRVAVLAAIQALEGVLNGGGRARAATRPHAPDGAAVARLGRALVAPVLVPGTAKR